MDHTPRGVVEFHPTPNGLHIADLKQNPVAAYLLVNDADINDNIPWADSSPDHQPHINTVCQNLKGTQKNKFYKLSVPAASWAWLLVPPNAISKPWYTSICLKTTL